MGADAAGTVREIRDTRERLGRDLDVLQARLPDPEDAARAAAIGAGAGLAALASLWLGWSRFRSKRERRELEALLHDAGVAAAGDRPEVKGGAWKVLAGLVGAGAFGVGGYLAAKSTIDGTSPTSWMER